MSDDATLTHLLDTVEEAAQGETVSVQDVLDHIGDRSIMPIVLAISLILVSPLSGIPGLSTVAAIIIVLVMGQALMRRDHLWLPQTLSKREIKAERLETAVNWLRKPSAWVDKHSHPRLRILTSGPLRWLTLGLCLVLPMVWPFLEFLPFVTSIGACALALMTFGLLTRDGVYVLCGYVMIGCLGGTVYTLVQVAT